MAPATLLSLVVAMMILFSGPYAAAMKSADNGLAPRRMLLGHATTASSSTAPEITSMATLEAVATPNSKDARSQWVNAYVSAARSGMRTAAQRVHNVLGLGRESVKGRMLQQTFSAAQHAPAAAGTTTSGTRPTSFQAPHVESTRPSGASSIETTSAMAEPLRSVTPSGYATATPGSAGTIAHTDVVGPATVVRPPPSAQGTASTAATTSDATPSGDASVASNTPGSIARADVVGGATVVRDPAANRTPSVNGATPMAETQQIRDVTPSGYTPASSTPSNNAHPDVASRNPTRPTTMETVSDTGATMSSMRAEP